jgi:hypothetical protein
MMCTTGIFMEIMAIIEPDIAGYRARCRHPVEAVAIGHSSYDARLALESVLRGLISDPFTILALEATPDKPWIATAGSIPEDSVTNEWLVAIEEYRRECDFAAQQTLAPVPSTQPTP